MADAPTQRQQVLQKLLASGMNVGEILVAGKRLGYTFTVNEIMGRPEAKPGDRNYSKGMEERLARAGKRRESEGQLTPEQIAAHEDVTIESIKRTEERREERLSQSVGQPKGHWEQTKNRTDAASQASRDAMHDSIAREKSARESRLAASGAEPRALPMPGGPDWGQYGQVKKAYEDGQKEAVDKILQLSGDPVDILKQSGEAISQSLNDLATNFRAQSDSISDNLRDSTTMSADLLDDIHEDLLKMALNMRQGEKPTATAYSQSEEGEKLDESGGIMDFAKQWGMWLAQFLKFVAKWKYLPIIGGILVAIAEYLESGDAQKAIAMGLGSTAGAMAGRVVGAVVGGIIGAVLPPLEPVFILAGMLIGGWLGEEAVKNYFEPIKKQVEDFLKNPAIDSIKKGAEAGISALDAVEGKVQEWGKGFRQGISDWWHGSKSEDEGNNDVEADTLVLEADLMTFTANEMIFKKQASEDSPDMESEDGMEVIPGQRRQGGFQSGGGFNVIPEGEVQGGGTPGDLGSGAPGEIGDPMGGMGGTGGSQSPSYTPPATQPAAPATPAVPAVPTAPAPSGAITTPPAVQMPSGPSPSVPAAPFIDPSGKMSSLGGASAAQPASYDANYSIAKTNESVLRPGVGRASGPNSVKEALEQNPQFGKPEWAPQSTRPEAWNRGQASRDDIMDTISQPEKPDSFYSGRVQMAPMGSPFVNDKGTLSLGADASYRRPPSAPPQAPQTQMPAPQINRQAQTYRDQEDSPANIIKKWEGSQSSVPSFQNYSASF
jgi:hypothetical protein